MKAFKILIFLFCILILSSVVFAFEVEITPPNPTTDDELTCNLLGVRDFNLQHNWYVNDYFVETSITLAASFTNPGDEVTCIITLSDGSIIGGASVVIAPEEEPDPVLGPEEINHAPSVRIVSPRPTIIDIGRNFNSIFNIFSLGRVAISPVFHTGEPITFRADGVDPDGDRLYYSWNFAGERRSYQSGFNLRTITNSFSHADAGLVEVIVRVRDPEGLESSDRIIISIIDNEPPVAVVHTDGNSISPGSVVSFSGFESYDPDGEIVMFKWEFFDTNTIVMGPTANHRFDEPGIYSVSLTVRDNYGLESMDYVKITVTEEVIEVINLNPVADAGDDKLVIAEQLVEFDGSESYDPDGEIVDYGWDFGDGTSGVGSLVTHSYPNLGVYTATLIVIDNEGASDSDSLIVTVEEESVSIMPVAVINAPTTTAYAGFPITLDGFGSYDLDGEIVDYGWEVRCYDALSNLISIEIFSGAELIHNFDDEEICSFSLIVTDDDNLQGSTTIDVAKGVIDFGSDRERRITNPHLRMNNFDIGKIMPSVSRSYYNRGERVTLYVKLTNENDRGELLDFQVSVPEFNYVSYVNNYHINSDEVKWLTIYMDIPSNALPGLHIAKLSLSADNEQDVVKNSYWQFIVA